MSIFAQKYLLKCKDNYSIIQNKYHCIYKDSFGAKIFRDDFALGVQKLTKITLKLKFLIKNVAFSNINKQNANVKS